MIVDKFNMNMEGFVDLYACSLHEDFFFRTLGRKVRWGGHGHI
jgi:hypothetical protein